MSKGLPTEEIVIDTKSSEWVVELKSILNLKSKRVDILGHVEKGKDHPSQKDGEGLKESREKTDERLKSKEEQVEVERKKQEKVREQDKQREQLRHDAIRDGNAILTPGKEIKSGCHGSVSFLESDNNVSLVVKTPKSDTYQKELLNEEEIYNKIGDHPNIVRCYGMQKTTDGKEGLVLERIQGCVEVDHAFRKLDKQYESGKLTYAEYFGTIQNVMKQLLTGLAHLEECGFSHNDIKDDNVMIDSKTGEVKIIDIGLATEHGQDAKTGAMMYQAPDKYNEKSKANDDSYSAGAILQRMVEGRIKFLSKGDKAVEVVKGEIDGRQSGKTAHESEYVKFVNALSNPDPTKRLKPSEALQLPFLTESLLDEESSGKFLTSFLEKQPDRTQITFDLAEDFTSADWTKTYENAVESGAVPEAVALSVAVSKGLDAYNDTTSDPASKQKALQGTIDAWKKIQAIPAYREHPTMSSYLSDRLEDARENLNQVRQLAGGPPLADITFDVKGPTFDAGCWGTAYQNAVAAGAVEPDPAGSAAIRDSFGAYRTAKESFEKNTTWYELRSAANFAKETLAELGKQIAEIKKAPGYSENKVMAGLLQYFTSQIPEQQKPFDASLKQDRPFAVVEGFTKDAFVATCDNAMKALSVPDCKEAMKPAVVKFGELQKARATADSDSTSWTDRAVAAREAAAAAKDLDKAISDLASFFRKEMSSGLTKYLDNLKKLGRPLQDEYTQLAAWCDTLKDVGGLDKDKEGIKKVLELSNAYQQLTTDFKSFERSSNWDDKLELAKALVKKCTEIQDGFKVLGQKYPNMLPDQTKDVGVKLLTLTEFLDHGSDFAAEKKFASASWAKSYRLATNGAAVPKSDVDAQAITDGLKKFEDGQPIYRDEKKDWDDRNAAGQDGLDGLKSARDAAQRLQLIDLYRKNTTMGPLLTWLLNAIGEDLKVLQGSYDKFTATGKTIEVNADFRGHWQTAKDAAEQDFDNAKLNMRGVSRKTKFSKYLTLDGGLSPALKDFEEACADAKKKPSTKADDKKKSTYAKVEKIIGGYRQKLITESRKWQDANIDAKHHFWTRLLKALNEIFTGMQKLLKA